MPDDSNRSIDNEKLKAAARSLDYVEHGMLLGLGTGTTVAFLIPLLGKKVKAGLSITAMVTSKMTEQLAHQAGIKLIDFDGAVQVDLTIDGADEINERLDLIKGGGGALLHEKILAVGSKREIIIADASKLVKTLGAAALPVEVIKYGWQRAAEELAQLDCVPHLRLDASNVPFITEEGNYILDCRFRQITNPSALAEKLDHIVGVVEHGLFINLADEAIVGTGETTRVITSQTKQNETSMGGNLK
jgi:ribose 5-phosphate isomerase A